MAKHGQATGVEPCIPRTADTFLQPIARMDNPQGAESLGCSTWWMKLLPRGAQISPAQPRPAFPIKSVINSKWDLPIA